MNQHLSIAPATSPLSGTLTPPGDKSITHRALFFGALNKGRTVIVNPSSSLDCRATAELLTAIGHHITEYPDRWQMIAGKKDGHRHSLILDCHNSGTTARLAAGFLTGERGVFRLTGDASLRRRPMERVAEPLRFLGADVRTTDGTLPVTVTASGSLPGNLGSAIATGSAQVHASVVLAALRSDGGAVLTRTSPMRDHTLRMLRQFGAGVTSSGVVDVITPLFLQRDVQIDVPGDVSSAAFMVAAAVLVPGSDVLIRNVGLNPTRIAFLNTLRFMGADVQWRVLDEAFEPYGEIRAGYSPALSGAGVVQGDAAGGMIDELPLLMLLASQARGNTTVSGAGELRLKESDRIGATVKMLRLLGIEIEEHEDGFSVAGPQKVSGGMPAGHAGDHRLCMTAAVAAMVAREPVTIPDSDIAMVSYPAFWEDLVRLGGKIFSGG